MYKTGTVRERLYKPGVKVGFMLLLSLRVTASLPGLVIFPHDKYLSLSPHCAPSLPPSLHPPQAQWDLRVPPDGWNSPPLPAKISLVMFLNKQSQSNIRRALPTAQTFIEESLNIILTDRI